jgi:4-hydroxy-tetrahydrodipicolinate reductase
MPEVNVAQYGLGSIGCNIARHVLNLSGYRLVGAIDIDPQKIGKDLGEVLGLEKELNVVVSGDTSVLGKVGAELVLHSTTSKLKAIRPQLVEAIEAGCNVISTCEELVYPYARNPEVAMEIDRLAKEHGVAVLGVGVNPGFVMDTLVLMLTAVCQDIKRIKITRIVDASKRRLPLQKKIGASLSVKEFNDRVAAGTMGHVGLTESTRMVTDTLGWELDSLSESIEPVIARKCVQTKFLKVEEGMVVGIKQITRGMRGGKEVIALELQMYVGAEDPYDEIYIDGVPPIDMFLRGGVHGDSATVALVVNYIPHVLASGPGLITTRDLPIPFYRGVKAMDSGFQRKA